MDNATRTCEGCGNVEAMAARSSRARYCSVRCQQRAAERRRPKRPRGSRREGAPPRVTKCEACSEPFDVNEVRSTRSTRFCSSRCYEWQRTHATLRRSGRSCAACGIPIDHLRQGAKTCGDVCRRWHKAHPDRVRQREVTHCLACGKSLEGRSIRAQHCDNNCFYWSKQHPGIRKTGVRLCLMCRADISARGSRALYCSERCFWSSPGQLERSRAAAKRRRAMLAGCVTVGFTTEQLEQRLSMYGNRCYVCGDPGEHVDHVKPVSRRGAHMLANFRPICASCNSIKKARWPLSSRVLARGGDPAQRRALLKADCV